VLAEETEETERVAPRLFAEPELTSTRLRDLEHRTHIAPPAYIPKKRSIPPVIPDEVEQFEPPPFAAPELTTTRLRNLSHRTHIIPPTYVPKTRKQKAKPEPEPEPESELPDGTVSILSLLSELDLARETEAREAMPVALRRPSTTHKTRSNSNEKSHLGNGLVHRNKKPSANKSVNEAAHAQNQNLQNGLPESTHMHPSQKPSDPTKPSHREEKDREKALERNIDRVVFGDVMFKAWYPSWYPAQIIGEKALDGKGMGIVVPTLYVCKKCFGYGKEAHEWIAHCKGCVKETPGARVYTHGGEEGIWSVWEVDGSVDTVCFPFSSNQLELCRKDGGTAC